MFVSTILRIVMRLVNAAAHANHVKAERLLSQHLARAGRSLG